MTLLKYKWESNYKGRGGQSSTESSGILSKAGRIYAMNPSFHAILVVILYLTASFLQWFDLKNDREHFKPWILVLAVIGLVLQAWLLHEWIDLGRGQNLSFFNMLSLLCWLITLLIVLLSLFEFAEVLLLLIFPASAVSVLMALKFPGYTLVNTAADSSILLHVLLSVVSFGVLCIAGMQALILLMTERVLRARATWGFRWRTPPLQSMEQLLFQTIWLGFILLSMVLVSSVYSYHQQLLVQTALLQKTILASLAWLVFAMLLTGRHLWGWRGRRVSLGTLAGILVLIVAYLGAKILWKI